MISYDICLYLTSLSMIISRSIHVTANGIISFFFYDQVIFQCAYALRLLHPFFVNGHLRCSNVLAIMNCAAVNTGV